ncbi:MAG: hypothetical protein LBG14_02750, partial [Treponema sp.]|nr:hypothetical protein [Treponema sp.]
REREADHGGGSLPPGSSRSAASATPLSGAPPRNAPPVPPDPEAPPLQDLLVKAGQGRREAEKQKQAHIRRLRRQEAEILAALEALEAEKAALETELVRPAVYSSGEKARAVKARLDRVSAEAEGKSREWEAKARELEKAQAGALP